MNAPPRTDLVEAIVAYLADRPQAADSVAGVTRWWLGLDTTPGNLADVEAALQRLVQRGRLRIVESGGQGPIYGVDSPTPRH